MFGSFEGSYCLHLKFDYRGSWFLRNVIKFVPYTTPSCTTPDSNPHNSCCEHVTSLIFSKRYLDLLAEVNSRQVLAGFTSTVFGSVIVVDGFSFNVNMAEKT